MQSIESKIVNGLRVTVFYDENGYSCNPRDNDNVAVIYGETARYNIGDGKPPRDEQRALDRGGMPLLARYLRMMKGAVALRAIEVYDHSGVSYSTESIGRAGRGRDWDAYTAGYAYVTREAWAETGRTDDPTALYLTDPTLATTPVARTLAGLTNAEAIIEWEVEEYGQWANGEVYGYTVTRPCTDKLHYNHDGEDHDTDINDAADCDHAEELDSCWGFVGDSDYAMAEGVAFASSFTREAGA